MRGTQSGPGSVDERPGWSAAHDARRNRSPFRAGCQGRTHDRLADAADWPFLRLSNMAPHPRSDLPAQYGSLRTVPLRLEAGRHAVAKIYYPRHIVAGYLAMGIVALYAMRDWGAWGDGARG